VVYLKVQGSRLYGNGGLTFDISTPSAPSELPRSVSGWAMPFALVGDLLVSVGYGDDLRVYDTRQSETATYLGSVLLPGKLDLFNMTGPDPIQLDGNWAWVARTDSSAPPGGVRLMAVDLSCPAQPMPVASFLSEERHQSFLVHDGVLWLVSHEGIGRDLAKIYAVRSLRGAVSLREDNSTGQAGARITYHVDFTDRDGKRPPRLRCAVTGGSCAIVAVDLDAHTAEVSWDLPAEPGDAELAVVVGNERWSAVATDWLVIE
jgi:hypothetical protein